MDIAIVGGGCSGTLVAVQLLRNGFRGLVTIVEPRERLGLGLAYSTSFDQHLLNVPAADMSALPGHCSHFLDWLRVRYRYFARPDAFVPRRVYGEYLNDLLRQTTQNGGDARFRHIRGEAIGFSTERKNARITLNDGSSVLAERVVLALGNPTSSDVHTSLRRGFEDRWQLSPWFDDALRVRFPGERILLLGTGLTAVDAALALQSQDTPSEICMLSRRGILPQVHNLRLPAGVPFCFRERNNLRLLLRELRERIDAAHDADLCWRSVIDSLRPISNGLWQGLSPHDRRRFQRHLTRYWDTHRHRMAPEIRARLNECHARGALRVIAGRLRAVYARGSVIQIRIRLKCGAERMVDTDRVISCTGVNENYAHSRRSVVRALMESGLAHANDLGHGFHTDSRGALLTSALSASPVFFTLGPPRRGQLFETTAVPEIRVQAADLAAHLIALEA